MTTILPTAYLIGVVRKGKLSKYFDYEVLKYQQAGHTYYTLEVDGDDEGGEWATLKEVMAYVKDLKENGGLP